MGQKSIPTMVQRLIFHQTDRFLQWGSVDDQGSAGLTWVTDNGLLLFQL